MSKPSDVAKTRTRVLLKDRAIRSDLKEKKKTSSLERERVRVINFSLCIQSTVCLEAVHLNNEVGVIGKLYVVLILLSK
jgi:hypothetical protein